MYPAVIRVAPLADFTLAIGFDNGQEGTLDMKPYLGFGAFAKLRNCELFKQVRIAFDTIEWDCGVDLDPEFVSKKCKFTATAKST
ncbi:MAG TPA: DUF2442 domain-containing protein [Planctomycetota bacterium]|jgi:hypothetical protein